MNKKGFTLIELLVVIAIIGILASVVLASLGGARERGQIAALKSEMANFRSDEEIYYSDNNKYDCGPTSSELSKLYTSIKGRAKNSSVQLSCDNTTNPQAWAMYALLPGPSGKYWCVDSTGANKEESQVSGSSCP